MATQRVVYVAINECGNMAFHEESRQDAMDALLADCGAEAVKTAEIRFRLDAPDLPEEEAETVDEQEEEVED